MSHEDPVDAIASGYQASQILLTANRLDLFAALGERALTADELAAAVDGSPRGVRILADALVALELLDKEGDRYRNAPSAAPSLLPGSPRSKRAMLLHAAALYQRWAGLYDAVKSGGPVPDDAVDARLERTPRSFAQAMADVARESAARVVEALDLDGVEGLLDIGGGPGSYAVELARRHPGLRAAVLDLPDTAAVARETIREAGLGDRVEARAGDAFTDDLGGPWDLIFTSNLVHIYPAADNRRLVARCAAALAPGGRLAIKDFLLDPGRTSPQRGALFAVNMLVATEGGDCYTVEEVGAWMRDAGLVPGQAVDLTPQSRLLVGRKPAPVP